MTESTSTSIQLNSSRQVQAPVIHRPQKSLSITVYSICSEQLNTTHYIPSDFAKSFVDSVFPVPAGPAGAAPNLIFIAPVIVIQHLSVKGVITNQEVAPIYSYP